MSLLLCKFPFIIRISFVSFSLIVLFLSYFRTCPMLYGGGQERGLRAGTENILLIVGLGEAARLAFEEMNELLIHMLTLKLQLLTILTKQLNHLNILTFHGQKRSNNYKNLENDYKIIKSIVKNDNNNNQSNNNQLNENNDNSSINRSSSLLTSGGGSLSIVEQLPNTISIAFKGLNAQQMLKLLYNKVNIHSFIIHTFNHSITQLIGCVFSRFCMSHKPCWSEDIVSVISYECIDRKWIRNIEIVVWSTHNN